MTFFNISSANIFPAIQEQTRKPLVVYFATARCIPWGINAGVILPIWKMG